MSWERAMSLLPDAAEALGVGLEILSNQEAQSIRQLASQHFSDGTGSGITSENLVNLARLSRDESWKLIAAFGFSGPVILFTNYRDGKSMFKFSSVGDAVAVIGEAPPFDFYLVDRDCTFLFAHDEYENLFGCGTAKAFVESL